MDVRSIRIQLKLSQREFAEILGISRSKLARIELGMTGLPQPSFSILQQLVARLDGPSNALPQVVQDKLNAEEQKSKRRLDLVIYNKQLELKNAIEELKTMRAQHTASANTLAVICDEIEVFKNVPIYCEKLAKMYAEALKAFITSNPTNQRMLELRIVSVKAFLDAYDEPDLPTL